MTSRRLSPGFPQRSSGQVELTPGLPGARPAGRSQAQHDDRLELYLPPRRGIRQAIPISADPVQLGTDPAIGPGRRARWAPGFSFVTAMSRPPREGDEFRESILVAARYTSGAIEFFCVAAIRESSRHSAQRDTSVRRRRLGSDVRRRGTGGPARAQWDSWRSTRTSWTSGSPRGRTANLLRPGSPFCRRSTSTTDR